MLTLQQLTTPVSENDALATILSILSQLGLQTTSWQTGSLQLTVFRLIARLYSGATNTIANVAAGGFTTLSSSNWLTLIALYVYNLPRLPAQQTIGKFLLTSSAGAPVHTWSAGDIIVSDSPSGTAGANTYTVTAGGILNPNNSLSVEFKADVAGAAANIAPNVTLYLWTPLVGVTPTNPPLTPSNTWITTPGADIEADQRLIDRCIARWPMQAYGNMDGAYKGWALNALPALTRAQVLSAPGDGTVTLVGATSLGPIDAGQILTIENYINGVTDGIGRRPINDIFDADGATTVTVPALNITAYCTSATIGTAPPAIVQALLNYFGSIPIGGTIITGTQGRVLFAQIVAITQSIAGVRDATFNISSDVLLSPGQIYVPVITVTPIAVAPGT